MIKIQINRVLETCIVVDSAVYKPVYSCEATDFYEIPCKLNEKINMQIIHYSRSYNAGIYSVINNKRNNKLHSLIGEMKHSLFGFAVLKFCLNNDKCVIFVQIFRVDQFHFFSILSFELI